MDNITFQYPSWYILLCILLGLAYAAFLYFRDKNFREQSRVLNWALGSVRFLSVTLIAVLLLSPLLKHIIRDVKKPVVVLAQDVSESVAAGWPEAERSAYRESVQQLARQLEGDFEVKEYSFGSSVREGISDGYTDKLSNLSDVLSTVYDLYSNQNLGAVILATDGIYNEGSNPLYLSTQLGAPVFTIALGDTTAQRDLIAKRVFHNRIAYLGDKFSVQVDIAAENASGSKSQLSVYKVEGNQLRKLQQSPVDITSNDFFETRELILEASPAGVQRYRVVLSEVPGEASTANNSKDIFVDVLDARQKILILANSPHPDISAFRQALSSNKNYEIKVAYIDELKENVTAFDFVILHQLPSRANDAAGVLNTIRERNIPHFFIVGSQSNLSRLNQLQSMVSVRAGGDNTNEVQARVDKTFGFFKLSERLTDNITNFPPLLAPFGEYSLSGNGQVLLYQRIGKVDTRYPLLALGEEGQAKAGILFGEGLWKWRLFDYLQNQNHDIFDELVTKTVQYLSLKEDKRRFRASLNKNIFNENESIYFDAELYNESFELVNEPDARMAITDGEGKEYNFTFNRVGEAYRLNAGILPVGNYNFQASTNYNGENLTYTGQFSVQPIQLESYETTADHGLLRLLSDKYGGQLVYPADVASIDGLIRQRETVKPVIYETARTQPVINLKWLFFALLGLLTVEWFFRRYFGGY
ncbi:MAG: VWA domain-containing protein [Lewinellaceae bacterium]|nr:VWA domain-containing protein [Phaeodactylibacter sp.]MCB0614794.1 VWA domain-containing protein [Phaeodactylibacter sp.]MCB9346158.1 VWA domain-containing protein [Lewinellaceae bacterium]